MTVDPKDTSMCDSDTELWDDRKDECFCEGGGGGCAGFPEKDRCRCKDLLLERVTVSHSFGDAFELEFIDGVTETEFEETKVETLLDSVLNSLSRRETHSLKTGKGLFKYRITMISPGPSLDSLPLGRSHDV